MNFFYFLLVNIISAIQDLNDMLGNVINFLLILIKAVIDHEQHRFEHLNYHFILRFFIRLYYAFSLTQKVFTTFLLI